MTIFQTPGTPDLGDALLGFLLLFVALAYRADLDRRFVTRAAFALVNGAALWLIAAGLLYTGLTDPALQDSAAPYGAQIKSVIAERFWFPAGWAALSLLAFVAIRTGRKERP